MLININGKDIGKELPAINVINPFNGECIDTVPDVSVELMDEAVKAAQEGLKIWGGLSQANRNAVIYKYIQLYESRRHEISELLVAETGKTLREACAIATRLASTVICTSENICPRFMPEEFGITR